MPAHSRQQDIHCQAAARKIAQRDPCHHLRRVVDVHEGAEQLQRMKTSPGPATPCVSAHAPEAIQKVTEFRYRMKHTASPHQSGNVCSSIGKCKIMRAERQNAYQHTGQEHDEKWQKEGQKIQQTTLFSF